MSHRFMTWVSCFLGIVVIAGMVAYALHPVDDGQKKPEPVTFSHPSGFYNDAFYLEMKGNENAIYYTLDSSEPTEDSMLYTDPICVQDASLNENVYSAITDTSVWYDSAIIEKNGKNMIRSYMVPDKPVDKATVVRAVCIDAFGNRSQVSTAVYFVGFGEKKGYSGMNIMAITTDPDNLFDSQKGIYVLGDSFKKALHNGVVSNSQTPVYKWPANYREKGREWEREALVHCFDCEDNLVFSEPCGIRIQGRSTRSMMPKNLNIYARKEYGSAAFYTGDLFKHRYVLNRLNLFRASDNVMLKDYLINEMMENDAVVKREMCPCVLFLNGEYWGVYWLASRFKPDYLNQKYGVKKSNIISIKTRVVEIGQAEDIKLYNDMVSFIADNDMRDPKLFERACEMIDLQSFIDYFAVEIYIANTDWPNNNFQLWRSRNKASNIYSDGRWRWMLYDLDHAMGLSIVEQDSVKRACMNPVFASLMRNEDFYRLFIDRLLWLANEILAPERVNAFIDAYESDMAEAIEKKYQRFYGKYDMDKLFYARCEEVRQFFRLRQTYINNTYGGMK